MKHWKTRKYCIYGSWCNLNLASAANSVMIQFQKLLLHLMNDWLVVHDSSTLHRQYGDPSLIYHTKHKPCSKYRVINFLTIFHLAPLLHSVNSTHGTHYNIQCLQEHSIMHFCKILGGGAWRLLFVIYVVMLTISFVGKEEMHFRYKAKNLLLS